VQPAAGSCAAAVLLSIALEIEAALKESRGEQQTPRPAGCTASCTASCIASCTARAAQPSAQPATQPATHPAARPEVKCQNRDTHHRATLAYTRTRSVIDKPPQCSKRFKACCVQCCAASGQRSELSVQLCRKLYMHRLIQPQVKVRASHTKTSKIHWIARRNAIREENGFDEKTRKQSWKWIGIRKGVSQMYGSAFLESCPCTTQCIRDASTHNDAKHLRV
jgi:hypothetical protein